jgi:hypothetical protein
MSLGEAGSLIAVLTGVSGTLAGALFGGFVTLAVGWLNSRRERRLNLTLALFSEFHSPQFNQIRIRAYEVLNRSLTEPFYVTYEAASLAERADLSSILHFFEKVALLMKSGAVEPRLMRRFLRQYAAWWQPLLCPAGSPAFQHPEWGATLRDVDWLFAQLRRRR